MWEQAGEDQGRWTELVNSETGESSIKTHKLKVVWKSCKPDNHVFELTGNREVTCKKCKMIKPFILGQEVLVDGKLKAL